MDCRLRCGYARSNLWAEAAERLSMRAKITIPLDDAMFERARAEAAARGMAVEAYLSDLVRQHLPPSDPAVKGDVSSIFSLVKDGEPTDIARDKDKLIGESAWQEHLEETKKK